MDETRLIHLRLPVTLIAKVDRLANGRPRSTVVGEALAAYLERQELLSVIRSGAGSLGAEDVAKWPDDAAVDAWVDELRRDWSRQPRDDGQDG